MSEYFDLDPAEIKAQCREAIDNLNEVSSKTKDVEQQLDEFIYARLHLKSYNHIIMVRSTRMDIAMQTGE